MIISKLSFSDDDLWSVDKNVRILYLFSFLGNLFRYNITRQYSNREIQYFKFRQCCKNDIFISYGTKNARLISSQTGAHNYEISARWSYEQFIINEFSMSHDSNCLISRKFSSFVIVNPDISYLRYLPPKLWTAEKTISM